MFKKIVHAVVVATSFPMALLKRNERTRCSGEYRKIKDIVADNVIAFFLLVKTIPRAISPVI